MPLGYGFNPNYADALQQMQQMQALQGMALTPYTGNAPGGGAAQGIAQLVAALMANHKNQQFQQKYGIQPSSQPSMPQPAGLITQAPFAQSQGVAQQPGQFQPVPLAQPQLAQQDPAMGLMST